MLKVAPKNSGAKGIGKSAVPKENHTPTLASIGISKKESSRSQELAAVLAAAFEAALVVAPGKELNHNRVFKEAKENRQREACQEKRSEAAKDCKQLNLLF